MGIGQYNTIWYAVKVQFFFSLNLISWKTEVKLSKFYYVFIHICPFCCCLVVCLYLFFCLVYNCCFLFSFCFVFLRDYDWAGAMMNGCINKAGAIQGHAGQLKDLCFLLSWCNFGTVFFVFYMLHAIFFHRSGLLKGTEGSLTIYVFPLYFSDSFM